MSDSDKDLDMVKKSANELGEHFDSVHIFCTRHESGIEDGTVTVQIGVGNFYSRYGQIREWLIRQDEESREKARKDSDTD